MSPAIEDYALLGDLHTAALVSREGALDWLCLPKFDSAACFAALLDDESAGTWRLAPAAGGRATRRYYEPDTLVLCTEWETEDGTVRIRDFMPPRDSTPHVVRVVEGVSGRVPMEMVLRLRFDYGSRVPWVRHESGGFVAVAGPDAVWLRTPVSLNCQHADASSQFTVAAGQHVPFVLAYQSSHLPRPDPADPGEALADTREFWSEWTSNCRYEGEFSDAVHRALITLKALTYAPTGGILAAPTTSLPEVIGGERNWDYRYCWLRDATFTLQALIGTGYTSEAKAWREWLVRAVAGDPAELQIMYGVDGARRLPESTVDSLSGYEKSAPVRTGNAAAEQFQLDVWGEVLDGLHLAREAGLPATHSAWDLQRGLLDFLEGNWNRPDTSLWEVRGPERHFVHSKVMAWAGVDRAVRTVERHDLDGPLDHWRALRERIHADVCEQGYDAERETFTQYYGSHSVDAALLLLPRVGFLPWDDPRVHGTVNTINQCLVQDGLVQRHNADIDGVSSEDNTFLVCACWLADALHGIGRTGEARENFQHLLSLRNDVGLLAEEYDVEHRRHVGNFPQAFSMVGLVNTARFLTGTPTTTNATAGEQRLHSHAARR